MTIIKKSDVKNHLSTRSRKPLLIEPQARHQENEAHLPKQLDQILESEPERAVEEAPVLVEESKDDTGLQK